MMSRKNLKDKTVGSFGFSNAATEQEKKNKVFINESLCPFYKNLFRLVRMECQKAQWKFFWTRNGNIFAKKDEHSAPAKIQSIEDIESKIV
eukprot:gene19671-biopygen13934